MIYILKNENVKVHITYEYWKERGERLLRQGWKLIGYMRDDKEVIM